MNSEIRVVADTSHEDQDYGITAITKTEYESRAKMASLGESFSLLTKGEWL